MIDRFAPILVCLSAAAFLHSAAGAQEEKEPDPRKQAALTAEEADADFSLQGEYSGEFDDDGRRVKVGAQVIALGGGTFRAVGYPGGLPGDGWNGEKKVQVEAEREGDTVRFVGDKASGILKDGLLRLVSSDGRELGKLKKVVRKSPTLGKKAPQGARVLFPMRAEADGNSSPEHFEGRVSEEGLLMQGATSKDKFQGFHLHLEFKLSYMPYARGQARSNSGVYMQGRYEVQVLDSFGLEGEHNECGGIYSVKGPDVNMCFPPLSWQTYDVDFTPAKFNQEGEKIANARMTVRHNGVLVHDDVEVPKATTGSRLKEGPESGPLYIQDHGNPLRYRNIWLVEK